jgi:hypothetical protein
MNGFSLSTTDFVVILAHGNALVIGPKSNRGFPQATVRWRVPWLFVGIRRDIYADAGPNMTTLQRISWNQNWNQIWNKMLAKPEISR